MTRRHTRPADAILNGQQIHRTFCSINYHKMPPLFIKKNAQWVKYGRSAKKYPCESWKTLSTLSHEHLATGTYNAAVLWVYRLKVSCNLKNCFAQVDKDLGMPNILGFVRVELFSATPQHHRHQRLWSTQMSFCHLLSSTHQTQTACNV